MSTNAQALPAEDKAPFKTSTSCVSASSLIWRLTFLGTCAPLLREALIWG